MLRPVVLACSVAAVVFLVVTTVATAFKVEDLATLRKRLNQRETLDARITIQKRYTEYQDNALAYCTGSCMFKARLLYGECYDLCNWNGRAPSPWVRLLQGRSKVKHGGVSSSSSKHWQSLLANRTGRRSLSSPRKPSSGEQTASTTTTAAENVQEPSGCGR